MDVDPARYGFWQIAASDPDRVAIIDSGDEPASFGHLLRSARGVARGLYELGLRPGASVASVLPNDRSFMEAHLAAMESALYITPVNLHLAPHEVAHVLRDSEAAVVIGHETLADLCHAAANEAGVPEERRFGYGTIPGFRDVAELGAFGSDPLTQRGPGSVMMYTSGTTGKPKGVRRPLPDGDPNQAAAATAILTCEGFGIPIGHGVTLVAGPLYHAGPSLSGINALHVGHTLVMMEKWTAEGCLDLIERHGVTDTHLVPTMFHRLLSLPEEVRGRYNVSTVVSILHSGAPCPVELKRRMMDWFGPVVYETYGGTEAAATIAKPHRWLEKPGTVGRTIRGVTVKVLDDDGNECRPNETGTIYIRSDRSRTSEYFKDPEKTASVKRGDMITLGDVGYLDEDGFLFLRDRKIDMIISGGVNIYPAEVEAALLADARVADVAVIGVPDEEWGERVLAIVEPIGGVDPSPQLEAEITATCRERIAHFKCPKGIEFVAELPRLPNGKVEKRRLRDAYWVDRQRAI